MKLIPESLITKTGYTTVCNAAQKQCFTVYGIEHIESLLPTNDHNELKKLTNITTQWMTLLDGGNNLPLTQLDDIRDILKQSRAEGSTLPAPAFNWVRHHAQSSRIIRNFSSKYREQIQAVCEITDRLPELKDLEADINRAISDQGNLKDDASDALKSIRGKLNRQRSNLRSTIQRLMKKMSSDGMTSDEGATIRGGRMVIPVLAEYKRKVDGFIHDVSATGQTVYIEPVETLHINNEIRQLEVEEQREIERILRQLTSSVRKYRPELALVIELVGNLDSINARIQFGRSLDGSIPESSKDFHLSIRSGRNPILLLKNLALPKNKQEEIVPLNLELGNSELALIITGPNAGGKSVAMKTVALISMMHQSGFPVPLHPDSKLPMVSGFFVDLGDDQSIENDLSTFSSRLLWMKNTLKALNKNSLVLIDEAGAGTDPEEGGALFQAFIEEVVKNDARAIVTTHHGSLKVFAHEHPHVINGAMEFDQKTLSPTYRFKKGVPGSSFAFEIGHRMNLPDDLLQRARSLLGEQRDSMGNLLVSLEQNTQEAEELKKEFTEKLSTLERREKIYLDRVQTFDSKQKKILEKAYKDAEQIMKGANKRIEEAVEMIVAEGKKNTKAIKGAHKHILDGKNKINKNREALQEDDEKPLRREGAPVKGDFVLIGDSDTTGELIELSGNKATVLVNGMKIKANAAKLVKTDPPAVNKKDNRRSYTTSGDVDLSVGMSLNIRGMRGDDAISELMHYLDKAVARGFKQVEIIHGTGEGILKKLVEDALKERDEVKKFEEAAWEQGGPGCTVVSLK